MPAKAITEVKSALSMQKPADEDMSATETCNLVAYSEQQRNQYATGADRDEDDDDDDEGHQGGQRMQCQQQ